MPPRAPASVRPSVIDPVLYEEVNVRGTIMLLEAARRWPLRTFVFAYSSSVYGGLDTVPFRRPLPSLAPSLPMRR